MDMYFNLLLAALFLLSITSKTTAQDAYFFNIHQNKIYINPAYIGTQKSFTTRFNYRNQSPQLSSTYQTTTSELSQYLGKGNGISFQFVEDNAANIVFKKEFNFGYGKSFTFNENHTLSMGAQLSYIIRWADYSKLAFGDIIDPRKGYVYTVNDIPRGGSYTAIDFNIGLLYYSKHLFIGFSTKHIFEPELTFTWENDPLQRLYIGQFGGKIPINDVLLLPSTTIYIQGENPIIANINLASRYKNIQVDVGYSINNGIVGGIGVNFETISLGYLYGYTNQNRFISSIATHEIRGAINLTFFNKINANYFWDEF